MIRLIFRLATGLALVSLPHAVLDAGTEPPRFIYYPETDHRYISLSCTANEYVDPNDGTIHPGFSISTNVYPASPLADWNSSLTLSLALPNPPDGSVSVSAHADHDSQLSDFSITGDFGAFAGANFNGPVPGSASASTQFEISFSVTAEVDFRLDVYKADSLNVPQLSLSSTNSGSLTPFPSYPWSGPFTFSGTLMPDEIYTLSAFMSSSGNSGNVDPSSELFVLVIPEPSSFALLSLGMLMLAGRRLRATG